jgi:hypothetical protein
MTCATIPDCCNRSEMKGAVSHLTLSQRPNSEGFEPYQHYAADPSLTTDSSRPENCRSPA